MTIELKDYRNKRVVVASHVCLPTVDAFPPSLREHAVPFEGAFKVTGFVLGTVMDCSAIDEIYWVSFPWVLGPVEIEVSNLLKVLLDDEAEPNTFEGLPLLMS